MNLEWYVPRGILKDFVGSIIYMDGSGTGVAFPRMHQTIIINMGDRFNVSEIYSLAAAKKELSETIWINGKQETPFMLGNNGKMEMYVIGVQPGMLPYLADLPAIETNDKALGAEHWISPEIFNLREQLLGCPTIRQGFELIEKYLEGVVIRKNLLKLEKMKWIDHAMKTRTVEEICRSLGVTRKKLRSETQHYFGGSVKNIQGIIRFNNTLSEIANHVDRSLSSLHTYYDQAHFINDFKTRCGITPLQYKKLCQRYPEIRQTPNFLPLQKETFLQFIGE